MINIQYEHLCCGCEACVNACPKHCINFKEDEEGFRYPKIDKSTCIDCGLCEKVCPVINQAPPQEPLSVYAAKNTNEEELLKSSSGGIFILLAKLVLRQGGVVFGAKFDEDWKVIHAYAETEGEIQTFMGSKYVQSRIGNTYSQARVFLKQGRKVLFSGTPCQIAGLNHFLRKKYDNLITVDVICHGVPSPKVWGKYLSEVTNNGVKVIKNCKFRNKDNGWKRFNFKIEYSSKDKPIIISSYHKDNLFMRAFLSNMILRPSCYNCKAKSGRSHSDITIADFWGIQNVVPEMDDDKGTGLVLVNSPKGKTIIDTLKIKKAGIAFTTAIKGNKSWSTSVAPHPMRERFFRKMDNTKKVTKLIEKELKPNKTIRQHVSVNFVKFKVFICTILRHFIFRGV